MAKIIVEGPDGKKYAFPDDMPRAEINAFMKQKYGTKAPTETVNDYLARVVREQDATAARAKAKDVEATAAGRAQAARGAEKMGIDSPLMMAAGANALALNQRAGAGTVYDKEGTILPDEAAGLSALNSLGAFIPSMVNQEFGNRLNKARTQNPEAALVGDVAGGFLPGEVIGGVVSKAAQAIGPGLTQLGKMFKGGGTVVEEAPIPAPAAPAQDPKTAEMIRQITLQQERKAAKEAKAKEDLDFAMQIFSNYARKSEREALGLPDPPPTKPMPEPKTVSPYGDEFTDVYEEIDYVLNTGARADKLKINEFRDLVSRYPKDKLEKYVRNRLEIPVGRQMTQEDILDAAQQIYQSGFSANIKPMGFGLADRRGIAPREKRADTFFDERLTPQENEFVSMRKNGYSIPEIEKRFGVSKRHVTTVFDNAKNKGVDIGPVSRERVSDDILYLKEQGLTDAEIDRKTGAGIGAVRTIISKARRGYKEAGQEMPEWLKLKPTPMGFAAPEGKRASGFLDEMERGTEAFYDERLGKAGSNRNKAVEMARNGFSNDEIAEALDMTQGSVKVYLTEARKLGIDIPTGYRPGGLSKTDTGSRADVLALKQKGRSIDQIAALTGKSKANVGVMLSAERKRLRDEGAEIPAWLSSNRANGILTQRGKDTVEETFGAAVMSGQGSVAGMTNDLNGDGTIDEKDAAMGSALGLGLFLAPGAVRGAAEIGKRFKDKVTPQGFYHGTGGRIEGPLRPSKDGLYGPGIYLTPDKNRASGYAGPDGQIIETDIAGELASYSDWKDAVRAASKGKSPGDQSQKAIYKEAIAALEAKGFVGVKSADTVTVWRPENLKPPNPAKFETPGSPEWEAAKAKGLDMSQAGRMARAKEMGFDTETVLYHGTGADIHAFDPNAGTGARADTGTWLSSSPENASTYSPRIHPRRDTKGAVYPLVVRGKNFVTVDVTGRNWARLDDATQISLPSRTEQAQGDLDLLAALGQDVKGLSSARKIDAQKTSLGELFGRYTFDESTFSTNDIAQWARKKGYDGVRFIGVKDRGGFSDSSEAVVADTYVIFDPANIRSVNAAFDPDKAASPILTAGFGGKR